MESEFDAKRRVIAQFQFFDQDRNRVLDQTEFTRLLRHVDSHTWTASAINSLMQTIDADNNGVIDFDEFARWAFGEDGDPILKEAWHKAGHERLTSQFDKWDDDADGRIDLEKLAAILEKLDASTWTPKMIAQLLESLDSDHSGTIEFSEFMIWSGLGGRDKDLLSMACCPEKLSMRRLQTQEVIGPVAIAPNGGTFIDFVFVEMKTLARDAKIYYTIDGSEPTEKSAFYSRPVAIDGEHGDTVIVKAIAVRGDEDTAITARSFNIILPPVQVELQAGRRRRRTSDDLSKLKLSTVAPGATIYYTLDGTEPVDVTEDWRRLPSSTAMLYSEPIVLVDGPICVKAVASREKPAVLWSETTMYRIQRPFNKLDLWPEGGKFSESIAITIGNLGDDVVIRYTTDGSKVTERSQVYQSPIHVGEGLLRLNATAYRGRESLRAAPQTYEVNHLVGVLPEFVVSATLNVGRRASRVLRSSLEAVSDALKVVLNLWRCEKATFLPDAGIEEDGTTCLRFVIEAQTDRAQAVLEEPDFAKRLACTLYEEEFIRVSESDFCLVDVVTRPLSDIIVRVRWPFRRPGVPDYLDSVCVAYNGSKLLDVVGTGHRAKALPKKGDRVRMRGFPPHEDLRGAVGVVEDILPKHRFRVHLKGGLEGSHSRRHGAEVDVDWRAVAVESAGANDAQVVGCDGLVVHSGDLMETDACRHETQVHLARTAEGEGSAVSDLYFTMSPCYVENLSRFRLPLLEICDAARPEHVVLAHTFSCNRDRASSIVLARLGRRTGDGPWEVVALGEPLERTRICDGGAEDYGMIGAIIDLRQQRIAHGRQYLWPIARMHELFCQGRAVLPPADQADAEGKLGSLLARLFALSEADVRRVMAWI